MNKSIFITSPTGTLGLALIPRLLSLNYTIYSTTTHDLTSPPAQHLSSLGVNLTQATWDSSSDIFLPILSKCTAIFLNTIITFSSPESEKQQFSRLITLARQAGITQVIYNSAASFSSISQHFPGDFESDVHPIVYTSVQNKQFNETTLRNAGFDSYTILRGANFMQNFLEPKADMYPGLKDSGVWKMPISNTTKLPLVDAEDIAKFAVEAFQDPDRFHGKDINIVGDELRPEEIMRSLSKRSGRELRYQEIEREGAKNDPFVSGGLVVGCMGEFMSREETEEFGVELTSFEKFLKLEEDAVKKTYVK
ncbi:hypothetical protein QBC38DRAFT_491794 [Podospora fimiseda]|uniref:NmrA-like domain-containing protein n=1 Tax=Podospora fimiseda TaxID=252190 RepID=A0AAN7BFH2_9PEZI|nr:hypothetical protein QBC38DRAFT_491794 [Podospora fimiseda]